MHTILLISKYLRRKLAPMFAAMAVMLCTAMVIIVISVMGGFLKMMTTSVKNLTSDIIIKGDISGIPHYPELLEKLRSKSHVVQFCSPVVRSYGLLNISGRNSTVEVEGIDSRSMDQVIGFESKLRWSTKNLLQELEDNFRNRDSADDLARKEERKKRILETDLVGAGMTMTTPTYLGKNPAIVPGVAVGPGTMRDDKGEYMFFGSTVGRKAVLTVLRVSRNGQPIDPAVQEFTSVNEFKSGRYEIDSNRVYVSFEVLQKLLRMDAFDETDEETGKPTGRKEPARCSEIMVRIQPDTDLDTAREELQKCVSEFVAEHRDESFYPYVITWRDKYGTFIHAVEKEKMLLTVLFGIISVVAVAMIGVIFYMIVLEKTRDIGVLRALGVSKLGVMSVFLGYGLTVGIIGAGLGFLLAFGVVRNINEIQDGINEIVLWVSNGKAGFKMWDPRIYLFDKIPTVLDTKEVTIILIFAVLSSLAGSLVPAYLASRLDPVESLRYE